MIATAIIRYLLTLMQSERLCLLSSGSLQNIVTALKNNLQNKLIKAINAPEKVINESENPAGFHSAKFEKHSKQQTFLVRSQFLTILKITTTLPCNAEITVST